MGTMGPRGGTLVLMTLRRCNRGRSDGLLLCGWLLFVEFKVGCEWLLLLRGGRGGLVGVDRLR